MRVKNIETLTLIWYNITIKQKEVLLMKCRNCNKEFESKSYQQVYCCSSCRHEYNNKRKKANKKTKVKKIKQIVVKEVYKKICKRCNKEFDTTIKNKCFCSKKCCIKHHKSNELERKRKATELRGRKKFKKICKKCGNEFETVSSNAMYCCFKCRNTTDEAKAKRREYEKRKGLNSKSEHRKRFKGTDMDKDITLKKLIDRDNNICHICGQACDSNDFVHAKGTIICGDNYPSIDHIIPKAKGGLHKWDNIKLAHRKCNYVKNDNTVNSLEVGQTRFYI